MRLTAAAALLLGVGIGGFLAGRASRPVPDTAVNVDIVELSPLGMDGTRGTPAEGRLSPHEEGLLLVLRGPGDGRAYSDYEVGVMDREGHRVLDRKDLRPTDFGNFHLEVRRGVLRPGVYRLVLTGRQGGNRVEVAAYELRLLPGDPR